MINRLILLAMIVVIIMVPQACKGNPPDKQDSTASPVPLTFSPGVNTPAATANIPASSSRVLTTTQHSTNPTELTKEDDFLDQLAEKTWTYLSSDWATTNHLPWSWRSSSIEGGSYANTTEIGFLALSWLAAYDLQRSWSPSWRQTESEVIAILNQLRAWQTGSQVEQPNGSNIYQGSIYYQWYWISKNPPVVGAGDGDRVVPSVDNAWLAVSLITIREYAEDNDHPDLAHKADDILTDMDFSLWYDPEMHRFYWGETENPKGGFPADYYSNENRIINFVARAKGQLSPVEFQASLDALVQLPITYYRETPKSGDAISVEKAAWDGSYFTYTAPSLFIREMETPYGRNTIEPATLAQIAYAQERGYTAWGLSDCFDLGARGYVQQGAPPIVMAGSPETQPGLVTPHASALALITSSTDEAILNLHSLSTDFPALYSPIYGFRDSVMAAPDHIDYGLVSDRYSALAQEWLFLSIVNMQTGFIWEYFYRDEGVVAAHEEMFRQPGSN